MADRYLCTGFAVGFKMAASKVYHKLPEGVRNRMLSGVHGGQ